jgi:hypothetical protein
MSASLFVRYNLSSEHGAREKIIYSSFSLFLHKPRAANIAFAAL